MTLTPVIVRATFAAAWPAKVPPVRVTDPAVLSPARIFPLNDEVVRVAARLGTQNTLHGCPPPAMVTEKLVPVRAPLMRKIQTPSAGPVSVSTPVLATASTQYTPGARSLAARLPEILVQDADWYWK